MINRRMTLTGMASTVGLFICEPVVAAVLPKLSCGCPQIHEVSYGHTCTIHDEFGKRWEDYTNEEMVAQCHLKIDTQLPDTEWSCFCGLHEDDIMEIGTKCVWHDINYENDESECECIDHFRNMWLEANTTDWVALGKQLNDL